MDLSEIWKQTSPYGGIAIGLATSAVISFFNRQLHWSGRDLLERLKNRESLRNLSYTGTVVVSQTEYIKTDILNPKTGNFFVKQKIRTLDEFPLKKLFNDVSAYEFSRYLREAARLMKGNPDNPLVLTSLDEVIPVGFRTMLPGEVRRQYRNSCANLATNAYGKAVLPDPAYVIEEKTIYPLLVVEPESLVNQFHILVINPDQLNKELPDDRDLLVEVGPDRFEHRTFHKHNLRLTTYRRIQTRFENQPELKDLLFVNFQTGKVIPVSNANVRSTANLESASALGFELANC